MLQRAAVLRPVQLCVLHKAGVVDRGRAVDDGIVVIDDEAGGSHGRLLCLRDWG